MKKLVSSAVVVAALAVPAISFAQSEQPLTRAQVRAELVELEQAGYNPAYRGVDYPQDLMAAQRRVDELKAARGDASGYGAPVNGTSATGNAVQVRP